MYFKTLREKEKLVELLDAKSVNHDQSNDEFHDEDDHTMAKINSKINRINKSQGEIIEKVDHIAATIGRKNETPYEKFQGLVESADTGNRYVSITNMPIISNGISLFLIMYCNGTENY